MRLCLEGIPLSEKAARATGQIPIYDAKQIKGIRAASKVQFIDIIDFIFIFLLCLLY